MEQIKIIINGKECTGNKGDTILKIATANGVFIPTLCHFEGVKDYGACGVCLVEGEGLPKLMRACSTVAADGWKLSTETDRVKRARKIAFELLMSDHDGDCIGPCSLNCPAGTDVQGYIKQIALGNDYQAVKIIKETNPLPAAIGRVCPHPCEKNCRRRFVEQPMSIAYMKYFAADRDLHLTSAYDGIKDGSVFAGGMNGKCGISIPPTYKPSVAPDTGKKVAIIGGGPAGLTAAFFLRRKGHAVTIYDAMPEMGGMLRYGIPEYRLPKRILQREIAEIANLGVELKNNIRIVPDSSCGHESKDAALARNTFGSGSQVTLEVLRSQYDAVIIAVGAWNSTGVGCLGSDAEGVIGGIDFLREVDKAVDVYGTDGKLTKEINIGKSVAVVGGGNTAMDACRTSIRLGAENVYVIYRRSRNEMPAADDEIDEAIEEGVTFKFLTNPAEIISENGKVKQIKLQVMQLGEPDASGRRKPVPVEGKFETLDVDTVISAIGQKFNTAGFEAIELNKKGKIAIDEATFRTNLEGVFAVGDVANNGDDIAIAAIGAANKAAKVIDSYLAGEIVPYKKPFASERNEEKVKAELALKEKAPRIEMPKRPAAERRNDFKEVNLGFAEADVRKEAARCLECGCHDYEDCRLIYCARQNDINPDRFKGEYHKGFVEQRLVTIERNQNKCILCNLCIRTCDENAKKGILGLVGRGFSSVIKPEFNNPETIACCKDCHLCADACPTGALKIIG